MTEGIICILLAHLFMLSHQFSKQFYMCCITWGTGLSQGDAAGEGIIAPTTNLGSIWEELCHFWAFLFTPAASWRQGRNVWWSMVPNATETPDKGWVWMYFPFVCIHQSSLILFRTMPSSEVQDKQRSRILKSGIGDCLLLASRFILFRKVRLNTGW